MSSVVIGNARILTLAGSDGPRRGAALGELGVIEQGWVRLRGETIDGVGPGEAPEIEGEEGDYVDAGGSVLMPAFVDCHTHIWSDERQLGEDASQYIQREAGRANVHAGPADHVLSAQCTDKTLVLGFCTSLR